MKLPIKKKWFDLIKLGKKDVEFRDAHITFVCEETGETLKRDIQGATIMPIEGTVELLDLTEEEMEDLFEDDFQIMFKLKEVESNEE